MAAISKNYGWAVYKAISYIVREKNFPTIELIICVNQFYIFVVNIVTKNLVLNIKIEKIIFGIQVSILHSVCINLNVYCLICMLRPLESLKILNAAQLSATVKQV